MLIKFETIDGDHVRVSSKTIRLTEKTKDQDELFGPYLVIVGEEFFTYGVSKEEFERLCNDFDRKMEEEWSTQQTS